MLLERRDSLQVAPQTLIVPECGNATTGRKRARNDEPLSLHVVRGSAGLAYVATLTDNLS